MKTFRIVTLLMTLTALFSGCQAFLEDYNYAPLGTSSSGPGY